jgi:glycosyltransferase involved in cell wall biosynthesis
MCAHGRPDVSVVMPCLNEAETVGLCISKAVKCLTHLGVAFEVIVADNGSTDGSQDIAKDLGAVVVNVPEKGYGAALMGGIQAARGRWILMGDADDSYDFSGLEGFVRALQDGADLVMGNRFKGGIAPGAMPFLNRYLGNPVLSGIGRLFFGSSVGDFHCGLRGFSRDAFDRMELRTTGMEFASEMVVKATLLGLNIVEVPTTLSPAGRSRPPHLRPWRDGWRHLRFLLLYSPTWLFLVPGISLMLIGAVAMIWLLPGPRPLGHTIVDVHTLLYAATGLVVGYQAVVFSLMTSVFAEGEGLIPAAKRVKGVATWLTLERGLLMGGLFVVTGLALSVLAVLDWRSHAFGNLLPSHSLRIVVPAVILLMLGVQTIFSSFFLSVLRMPRKQ